MEKPYQIEDRRAMQRFEGYLKQRPDPVQLLLPAVEIAEAMRDGVGEWIRRAGLELIGLVIEQEVEDLVGNDMRRRKAAAPTAGEKTTAGAASRGRRSR